MNRRDALKSLAGTSGLGVTGAIILATTSCVPTEAPASALDQMIERHRTSEAAWVDAVSAVLDADEPDPELIARQEHATEAEEADLNAILTHRPSNLDEAQKRAAFLLEGPFEDTVPNEEQIFALLRSMTRQEA